MAAAANTLPRDWRAGLTVAVRVNPITSDPSHPVEEEQGTT